MLLYLRNMNYVGGARINQDSLAERSLNQCSSALIASIPSLSRDFSIKILLHVVFEWQWRFSLKGLWKCKYFCHFWFCSFNSWWLIDLNWYRVWIYNLHFVILIVKNFLIPRGFLFLFTLFRILIMKVFYSRDSL